MLLTEHLVRCETGGIDVFTPWYKSCIERLQQIFLQVGVWRAAGRGCWRKAPCLEQCAAPGSSSRWQQHAAVAAGVGQGRDSASGHVSDTDWWRNWFLLSSHTVSTLQKDTEVWLGILPSSSSLCVHTMGKWRANEDSKIDVFKISGLKYCRIPSNKMHK